MNSKLFTIVTLGLLAFALAQDDDDVHVIRINIQSSDDSPAFNPLSMFSHRKSFPLIFRRFFSSNPLVHEEKDEQEEEPFMHIFQVQDEEPELPSSSPMFSNMFARLRRIMDAVRQSTLSGSQGFGESQNSAMKGRGCPLLRACQHDIDTLCSAERDSEEHGAVGRCLTSRVDELTAECAAVIERHAPRDHDQETHDEHHKAPEETPSPPESPVVPAVPSDAETAPAPVVAPTPAPVPTPVPAVVGELTRPCVSDIASLCRTELSELAERGLVGIMACLYRHKAELSDKCLQGVGTTPAFNCALDAQALCPGIRGRQNIVRCLQQKSGLSTDCINSVDQFKQRFGARNGVSEYRGHRVLSAVNKPSSVVAPAAAQQSGASTLPLAIGLSGLAVFVALVVALVSRRRRVSSAQPQGPQVLLSSPPVVELASPTYIPQPQEQL